MAATHPAYNHMKMPGSKGVLTINGDTKEAVTVLRLAFKAAAAAQPASTGTPEANETAPAKKKQLFTQDKAETKQIPVDEDGTTNATFTIGANLEPKQRRPWSGSCTQTRRYSLGSLISWQGSLGV